MFIKIVKLVALDFYPLGRVYILYFYLIYYYHAHTVQNRDSFARIPSLMILKGNKKFKPMKGYLER